MKWFPAITGYTVTPAIFSCDCYIRKDFKSGQSQLIMHYANHFVFNETAFPS